MARRARKLESLAIVIIPHLMLLSAETMRQARDFLAQFFGPTRLLGSQSMAENGIYFKLETDLPTGSFKVRGAMYALWSYMDSHKVREVVASSTGNHGAALAYAARHLGVPATIFLPANPNPVKADRIQRLGATLVESGIDSAAAERAARQHAQHTGAYFLHDASDANVPAGTASIAMEILDQLPEVNEICVPVGDTALIRGIASAVRQRRPEVRIIGVQAERAPSYYLSWRSGHAVETDDCNTIADGLATRTPEESNVQSIRELVDEMVLVGDQDMLRAIHHLLVREHIVAEPAGAATTAALLCAAWKPRRGPAVAIVSGANIAPDVLRKAVIGC